MVNKKFVWYSLRISFWIFIASWILVLILATLEKRGVFSLALPLSAIIAFTWILSIIWVFVTSIIHLTKYKQKSFAIVALVLSSLEIVAVIIGIIKASINSIV